MTDLLRIDKHLRAPHGLAPSLVRRAARLSLPFAERSKSRLRSRLADGREVALFLTRGTVLRDGDVLVCRTGELVAVEARAESILVVEGKGPAELMRAAYHLGNRHIRVEFGPGVLYLEADAVLEEMLAGLGLEVRRIERAFEPEPGAYGGGHRHGHDESFAEDYALAQAAYVQHEGAPYGIRGTVRGAPLHLKKHHPAHDHRHDHPHEHVPGESGEGHDD